EKWGLLKCTLIHYAATMGGFLLISLILKWYSSDEIPALLLMLLILTLVYLLIWLANFISYRIQLNKINRKIDLLKAKDRK
ncbi:MAG: DUF3021 family protein, partial [Lachnospiraceae bacterium]|nr:DUF3021 family protein [Lachnospiraceae bacterium]